MPRVAHQADKTREEDVRIRAEVPQPLDGEQAAKTLAVGAGRQVSRRPFGEAVEGRRAASGGLVDGALGTTTDIVSTDPAKTGSDQHKCGTGFDPCCRRRRRYDTRRIIWEITRNKRISSCGRVLATGQAGKAERVVLRVKEGTAYTSGLCVCANVWLCPVCSAKILTGRADEIAKACAKHVLDGGEAWMVTFTVRHAKNDALSDLFKALADAFRKLGNGVMAQREKVATGKIGTISSREITYGKNGWHPHLHVIVLFDKAPDALALAKMMQRWQRIWLSWSAKHGYPASKKNGVQWDKVVTPKGAGEYIAKTMESGKHIGNEVARGDLKKGKLGSLTPFEIIEYLGKTGDAAAVDLWHEYEEAVHRKNRIVWSPGLRKLLLDQEEEQAPTDDDLAAEERNGRPVAELTEAAWKQVVRQGIELKVLEAIERGGFPELVKLLAAHQVWAVKQLHLEDDDES